MRSARSGGTAARAEVSAVATGGTAPAGGVQGTSGEGDAARHAGDARRAHAPREEERRQHAAARLTAPTRCEPAGADGAPRHCSIARPIASTM